MFIYFKFCSFTVVSLIKLLVKVKHANFGQSTFILEHLINNLPMFFQKIFCVFSDKMTRAWRYKHLYEFILIKAAQSCLQLSVTVSGSLTSLSHEYFWIFLWEAATHMPSHCMTELKDILRKNNRGVNRGFFFPHVFISLRVGRFCRALVPLNMSNCCATAGIQGSIWEILL